MTTSGTTLHQVLSDETDNIVYRVCQADCDLEASWQESPPLFAHTGFEATAIAVTQSGTVHVAYNQGTFGTDQSPEIQAQNDRLLVWSCAADCLQPTSWSGFLTGAVGDGDEGIKMVALGDAVVIAHAQTFTVEVQLCADDCANAASWVRQIVDDAGTLAADYDPFLIGSCGGSAPSFAGWIPNEPSIALSPVTGAGLLAHAPFVLRTCAGTTSRAPGFGRLLFQP